MNFKLTEEQSQLAGDNINLVHYVLRKMKLNANDYDDAFSIGCMGLMEAAYRFDVSRNYKFSTLAIISIKHKLYHYHFNVKKKTEDNEISIQTSISKDEDNFTIEDVIIDTKVNFTEKFEEKKQLEHIANVVLNTLKHRARIIMLYRMARICRY